MSSHATAAEFPAVVLGAGVLGLAVAAELARSGLETLVLERHAGPARETSSRNSGVIHAGLYDEPGSAKARHCVRGNRLLYELCRRDGVPHAPLGKWVLATASEQHGALEALHARALVNGAVGVSLCEGMALRRQLPGVRATLALVSSSTGIVDPLELAKALEARFCAAGGVVAYGHELMGVEPGADALRLRVATPAGEEWLRAGLVVNATGLESDRVARWAGDHRWQLHWCRGDYFRVASSAARGIDRLLYPLPGAHGLGIHATLDLAGQLRLGPDATYVPRDAAQPDVDAGKAELFRQAAAAYLPQLATARLHADSWGLRPKLQAPGEPAADFAISMGPPGVPMVHLVGIESPGLTAALSIAEEVRDLLRAAGLLAGPRAGRK